MRKYIGLILIFSLSAYHACTQIKTDIIHLKNGNIIRGKMATSDPEKVVIHTINGSTMLYTQDEIELIEHKYYRYISYTSAGIILGSAVNEKSAPISVITDHNFQFGNCLAAGGMFGVELINETTVPLAASFKIYLPLGARTIYLNGTLGHSFSLEKPRNIYQITEANGGLLTGIDLGILIPIDLNTSIFCSIGYRYNELKYKYEDWRPGIVERTYYYNRLNLRFGIALY